MASIASVSGRYNKTNEFTELARGNLAAPDVSVYAVHDHEVQWRDDKNVMTTSAARGKRTVWQCRRRQVPTVGRNPP